MIDAHGRPIKYSNIATHAIPVEGDVSADVCIADKGILIGVLVLKEVASGTFDLEDNDAVAVLPQGKLDYAGMFECRLKINNGLKITTNNFTGGTLAVLVAKHE